MEKQFASYEIALKMKTLGFNEPCIAMYNDSRLLLFNYPTNCQCGYRNIKDCDFRVLSENILAPFWQQVFDFLREKEINIAISYTNDCEWLGVSSTVFTKESRRQNRSLGWTKKPTYDECREVIVLFALNLIAAQQ